MSTICIAAGNEEIRKILDNLLADNFRLTNVSEENPMGKIPEIIIFDGLTEGKYLRYKQPDSPFYLPGNTRSIFIADQSASDFLNELPAEFFDEIIFLPLEKSELLVRIHRLLKKTGVSVKFINTKADQFFQCSEISPVATMIIRYSDNTLMYINKAFSSLFGYHCDEFIGLSSDTLPFWESDQLKRIITDLAEGKIPRAAKFNAISKSGRELNLSCSVEIFEINSKEFLTVVFTEAENFKPDIHRITKHCSGNLTEILKTGDHAAENLHNTLQRLVSSAVSIIGGGSAAVYLLENEILYLAATDPELPKIFPPELRTALLSDHPHISKVIKTRTPIIIDDTSKADFNRAERTVIEARALRTLAYFPLNGKDDIFGIFIVGTTDFPRKITKDQITNCVFISEHTSIALESLRLSYALQKELAERKEAEKQKDEARLALVRSEQKYRLLADNSVDVIWQVNLRLKFTYVSPSIFQMTGFTQDEWIGSSLSEHASFREYLSMAKRAVSAIRNYKNFKNIVFTAVMIKKDGTPFPVEITSSLLYNDQGLPVGLQGSTRDITNRVQAENNLRESEQRLITAQRIGRSGDFIWDVPTGEVHWSDGLYDLLGYKKNEKIDYTKVNQEIHHPNDLGRVTQWLKECIDSGGDRLTPNEYRIISRDGNVIYVETMGVIEHSNSGVKVRATLRDITDRKHMEQKLSRSEVHYRYLFENNPMPMWIFEPRTYRVLEVNHAAISAYGYSRQEFLKLTMQEMKSSAELRNFPERGNLLFEGLREMGVWEHCRKDGTKLLMDIVLHAMDFQEKPAFLALANDVTEKMEAEQELKRIEWMLSKKPDSVRDGTRNLLQIYGDLTELNSSRLILDSVGKDLLNGIASDYMSLLQTSSAIYEKEGDSALGIFSSGWCKLMDEASWNLCGTDDKEEALRSGKWLCHESCWKDASLNAIQTGSPVDIECNGGIRLYALPIRAGSEIIGAINFGFSDPPKDHDKLKELSRTYNVPIEDLIKCSEEYESRPPYIIETAKDRLQTSANLIGEIVRRRQVEKQLRDLNEELEIRVKERTDKLTQINAELEAFSYSVSHDLRAPLRAITGFANILSDEYITKLDKAAVELLSDIIANTDKMGRLIDDLLEFSRLSRKDISHVKIDFNELFSSVLDEAGLISGRVNIKCILEDLPESYGDYPMLKQAAANLISNAVKFSAKNKQPEIRISGKISGNETIYCVADNGVGFDMKYAGKLFGVFQRLHSQNEFEGTGVGLALVKRILDRHKGNIWAESEPGKGAVFNFSLPNGKK